MNHSLSSTITVGFSEHLKGQGMNEIMSTRKHPHRRTHVTSLIDKELLLLDVLFRAGAIALPLLSDVNFYEQWLYPRHGMSDTELKDCLNRLVDRGLLSSPGLSEHPRFLGEACYEITLAGGEAWQSERKADWDRYAMEMYDELPSGRPTVTILATTAETLENFWAVARETAFIAYNNGAVKRAVITNTRNSQPIPWKHFPSLHVLVAVLDCWHSHSDDQAFEEQRQFWRSTGELMKFW